MQVVCPVLIQLPSFYWSFTDVAVGCSGFTQLKSEHCSNSRFASATLACNSWIEYCVWLTIQPILLAPMLRFNGILFTQAFCPFLVLAMCAVCHALPAASQPGVVDGSCPYEWFCPVLHFAVVWGKVLLADRIERLNDLVWWHIQDWKKKCMEL